MISQNFDMVIVCTYPSPGLGQMVHTVRVDDVTAKKSPSTKLKGVSREVMMVSWWMEEDVSTTSSFVRLELDAKSWSLRARQGFLEPMPGRTSS